MLESALESGFNSAGVDVVLLGPLPTTAAADWMRPVAWCDECQAKPNGSRWLVHRSVLVECLLWAAKTKALNFRFVVESGVGPDSDNRK